MTAPLATRTSAPPSPARTFPPPADEAAAARRRAILADLAILMRRSRDGKLEVLRQFLQIPNGRLFLPRSSQGPALFSRLVDLDVLFARAEQRLLRAANPMAGYEAKARLERDLCELHLLLIELCADLAATYDLEATDPAVQQALRRRRGPPAAGSAGGPSPKTDTSTAG